MTEAQKNTKERLEGQGFTFIEYNGGLVLVEKGDKAFYIMANGTYFAE